MKNIIIWRVSLSVFVGFFLILLSGTITNINAACKKDIRCGVEGYLCCIGRSCVCTTTALVPQNVQFEGQETQDSTAPGPDAETGSVEMLKPTGSVVDNGRDTPEDPLNAFDALRKAMGAKDVTASDPAAEVTTDQTGGVAGPSMGGSDAAAPKQGKTIITEEGPCGENYEYKANSKILTLDENCAGEQEGEAVDILIENCAVEVNPCEAYQALGYTVYWCYNQGGTPNEIDEDYSQVCQGGAEPVGDNPHYLPHIEGGAIVSGIEIICCKKNLLEEMTTDKKTQL